MATCLASHGEPKAFRVKEDAAQLEVEWEGTFSIDGSAVFFSPAAPSRRIKMKLGFDTEAILTALEGAQGKMLG